jgi:hypothetical protein
MSARQAARQASRPASQVRTAAKYYTCVESYAHDRLIAPGDKYVRVTTFPTYLSGGKPFQRVLCLPCGEEYQ